MDKIHGDVLMSCVLFDQQSKDRDSTLISVEKIHQNLTIEKQEPVNVCLLT